MDLFEQIKYYGCTKQEIDEDLESRADVVMSNDIAAYIEKMLDGTELLYLFFSGDHISIIQHIRRAKYLAGVMSYNLNHGPEKYIQTVGETKEYRALKKELEARRALQKEYITNGKTPLYFELIKALEATL